MRNPDAVQETRDVTSDINLGEFDFDKILAIVRRQWRVVAAATVIFLTLGVVHLLTSVPYYTSTATILIDSSKKPLLDEISIATGVVEDEAEVLSQVELLHSERIALVVSNRLDLKNDKVFNADTIGLLDTIKMTVRSALDFRRWFSDTEELTGGEISQQDIVEKLLNSLAIARVGRTYVLEIYYTSADPELSAKIARAFAEAYLTDQLDSKYEATRRASDWLQRRIAELRQKAIETDLAVQKFRAEKGLIASDGKLITDQQLAELTSQLIVTQADTAEAQAKYKRISAIVDAGDLNAAVTDSLASGVISGMREKFLDASRREADISNRLGRNHVQAVRLRNEMGEYKRLMFEELSRIAQSYKSNYDVALERQNNLEAKVKAATDVSANANDSQVQLRELEREAETYKKLYETFLERYQQAVQQQTFPVTEARIISNATPSKSPSAPKKSIILGLALVLGLGAGSAVAAWREFRDRFFRTGDQISEDLGLEFLGTIPLSADTRNFSPGAIPPVDSRQIARTNSIAEFVINHPLSAFAETLRSAKIAIDVSSYSKDARVVGIVSSLPGEGKSTVAINLAELLANQGARVLLIDGDLRNPGTTRMIGRHAESGILEVLQGRREFEDSILTNPKSGLHVLPAIVKGRIPYSSELLASDAMEALLARVRPVYDYVIFDLPPLAPVVDARAIASKIDTYVFVIEWGSTAQNLVRKIIRNNPAVMHKCCGVILNKVDNAKLKLYQQYGSSEFYYSKYSSYYTE